MQLRPAPLARSALLDRYPERILRAVPSEPLGAPGGYLAPSKPRPYHRLPALPVFGTVLSLAQPSCRGLRSSVMVGRVRRQVNVRRQLNPEIARAEQAR